MDERVFQEFLARFSDASDLKAAIIDDRLGQLIRIT